MNSKYIEALLRIGVFGIFFGHGIYALKQNPGWLPYLTFFGFGEDQALDIMLAIGAIDIAVAIATLLKPNKFILIYATLWGFLTALMRPLTGDEIWAFVERAGNWVVPLVLLLWINQDPSEHSS